MHLTKIRLFDFRNFREAEVEFSGGLNVLYGDNGQGKTNLLEAIHFLCNLRPVRTTREQDVIAWDKTKAYLKGVFDTSSGPVDRELLLVAGDRKKVRECGVERHRLSELYWQIHAVFFSPDDLSLVKGRPSERRRFLDLIIARLKPQYGRYLSEYNRALFHRNRLLKDLKKNRTLITALDAWDEQLSSLGTVILKTRAAFTEKLFPLVRKYYLYFSREEREIEIKYAGSIVSTGTSPESIHEAFLAALRKSLPQDLASGYTRVGPHRDDLQFLLGGRDLRYFGSQGEQRTLSLSLKFAERRVFFETTGVYPILLLDDAMSELDANRRRWILEGEEPCQVFVTTVDLSAIPEDILKKSRVYRVRAGSVG
ncbi:DNA replication/repair protein RecF [Thermosediminibacter oceani]|uniref:DNA replication and repair protein RecF n=1 Tax=Thermosediminibacter oceani (strain ATCC BAA-1034 / DSM 16646 / JW/IW-1228P) TaxID=555079 RepID=D9RYX3_THEOJ|nr:DNA replication/repair protein RecF [Thermosediminibacter oceani]ADL06801.1 DNA replication and repair protein RecF [Thermosediminibacter oceani DSM 16646]